MNSKEKAEQLIEKFENHSFMDIDLKISSFESAKQCALISVDEIMQVLSILPYGMQYLSEIDYWEGVKLEIEKL